MVKPHISQILELAGIGIETATIALDDKGTTVAPSGVVMSKALQLFGAHCDLTKFAETEGAAAYKGWQSHHVVGEHDLGLMGVAHLFPQRDEQFCVLLPEYLHLNIIHSITQKYNARGMKLTQKEFRSGYIEAYSMVGNYTGRSERAVQHELMRILRAIFLKMGQPLSKDDIGIFAGPAS